MRALVYQGPREMNIIDVEKPILGEDEVTIRVAYSGICGSELSGYLGKNALRKPPLIFGHEFAGTIVGMGQRVSELGIFKDGQRVTANPLITCGTCRKCLSGHQQLCLNRRLMSAALPGSNAEFVNVPASFVYTLPEQLSLKIAALTEPAACAVRAAELANAKPGDTVLILGMGPIGLLILQAIKRYGVSTIIAVDMNEERLKMAKNYGATHIICPKEEELLPNINELTSGYGVEIALDAVGSSLTRQQCIQACQPGGRVIFTGLHEEQSSLPVNLAIRNEIQMIGSFAYSSNNFETALQWLSDGVIGLEEGLVIADLNEGAYWFDRLLNQPGNVSKVLLDPAKGGALGREA